MSADVLDSELARLRASLPPGSTFDWQMHPGIGEHGLHLACIHLPLRYRREGRATRLLAETLALCDRHRVTASLDVDPTDEPDDPTRADLLRLYWKFGFRPCLISHDTSWITMQRVPEAPRTAKSLSAAFKKAAGTAPSLASLEAWSRKAIDLGRLPPPPSGACPEWLAFHAKWQEELRAEARLFRGDHDDGSAAWFEPDEGEWSIEDVPLGHFTHIMPATAWAPWLAAEIAMFEADLGHDRQCRDMIQGEIREPIVASIHEGAAWIWDGYHRVAASFTKQAKTVRAIVGRRGQQEAGTARA